MNNSKIIEEFDDKGFVILKDFIPLKKYEEVHKAICFHLKIDIKNKEINFENLKIHKKLIDLRKSKDFSKLYKSLQKINALNNLFNYKPLLKVIGNLIHCEPEMTMISGEMYRLDAISDKFFSYGWHQDSHYYRQNKNFNHGCVAIFPFTKCSNISGSLNILLRSHKRGNIKHKKNRVNKYFEINPDFSKKDLFIFNGKLGDVLLMKLNTIHKSGLNTSKLFRISAGARYHNTISDDLII